MLKLVRDERGEEREGTVTDCPWAFLTLSRSHLVVKLGGNGLAEAGQCVAGAREVVVDIVGSAVPGGRAAGKETKREVDIVRSREWRERRERRVTGKNGERGGAGGLQTASPSGVTTG